MYHFSSFVVAAVYYSIPRYILRGRYIYFHCNHAKSHVYHVRKSIYCTECANTLYTAELLKVARARTFDKRMKLVYSEII